MCTGNNRMDEPSTDQGLTKGKVWKLSYDLIHYIEHANAHSLKKADCSTQRSIALSRVPDLKASSYSLS